MLIWKLIWYSILRDTRSPKVGVRFVQHGEVDSGGRVAGGAVLNPSYCIENLWFLYA